MKSLFAATAAAVVCASSQAALIYSTNFDTYTNGNINSQTAWLGTGGSWAVTGSMNSGQLAGSIVANPSAGGTGKSVRLTTEKWNFGGRTKVWLDLANSGKWAAASTGANSATKVLRSYYEDSGEDAYLMNFRLDDMPDDEREQSRLHNRAN